MIQILRRREAVVIALLVVLVLVIGFFNPNFLQPATLINVANSSLVLMLIAFGEMFVLLTRGIDVSVGAITGISAVILGMALNLGVPLPVAVALALVTGLGAGTVNAVGVTVFRVPPIIMTLGTLGVYRGAMLLITGGSWIETIPQSIKSVAGWRFLEVPFLVWMTMVMAIATAIALRAFKQARFFYAVGDNEDGAYLLGIPVKATIFAAYCLAGLFAGAASVVFVAQIGFVPMQTGNGQELKAIAALVLGGVSLAGGVGSVLSAVLGALFLTAVDSMMIFLKVPGFWNNAVAGAILLTVVLIDYRIRRTIEEQRRRARASEMRHTVTSETPETKTPTMASMEKAG
jgi:AI-2 transport system permease protein